MIWGLGIGLLVIWIVRAQMPVWRPRSVPAPVATTPLPTRLCPDAWDVWHHEECVLWMSATGPLRRQGRGMLRCTGEGLIWISYRHTVTAPWDSIVALHEQAGGVLIHGVGLTPFVLESRHAAQLHRWLTEWIQRDWMWDGTAWITLNDDERRPTP